MRAEDRERRRTGAEGEEGSHLKSTAIFQLCQRSKRKSYGGRKQIVPDRLQWSKEEGGLGGG